MSSSASQSSAINYFRALVGGAPADVELLGRYVNACDQAAFAEVVRRYGGLVLGVARRQLIDADQAQDVFQATFLALARSAARLGRQVPLANWLYTVALRQARKARVQAARRHEHETACAVATVQPVDPLAEITGRELLGVVDEELERLPEKYRLPVLLCCVEGLSREEAARQLGWSDGAVKGRLERGRRQLATRLAERGFAPAALVLAPLAAVAVPADLLARTAALGAAPWSTTHPAAVLALATAGPPRRLLASALVCALAIAGLTGLAVVGEEKQPVNAPPPAPAASAEAPVAASDEPLPTRGTLRLGTSLYRQGTVIKSLSVSADGTVAVVGSGGHIHGALRVFDLTTGRVRATLNKPMILCDAVAVSGDGRTVATNEYDGVHLSDAATGKELRTVSLSNADTRTSTEWLTFAPDGKILAVATTDGKGIHLLDLEKGTITRTLAHQNVVFAAAFSPDCKLLAAGGYDSEAGNYFARLWDVATGKELRRFAHGKSGLRSLAFSPDGKTLAGGGDDARLRLWEVETGKEQRAFPADGYRIRSVAFAPDGNSLAAAGDSLRVYDPATGKERLRIDRKAIGLHFSADSKVLTGAVTGAIYRWDASAGRQLTPQSAGDSAVDQVLVSGDDRQIVTRGQDGDAHVWDARTGGLVRHLNATWQRGLALSPDGRYLVWPVQDDTIHFTDPQQPNVTHTGNRLRFYDLVAAQFVDRFPGFKGDAHDLSFTPDGKTLVTVDHSGGAVRLWDVASGKEQRTFCVVGEDAKNRPNQVWHAQLSPDGRRLAVTYQPDGRGFIVPFSVRLWDVATGKETHELSGHLGYVDGMAFSPDSRLLMTVSPPLSDFFQKQTNRPVNQVFVWDVATGRRLPIVPEGLPIGAAAGAFSPDGRTVATALPDGTIRLWEVASWTMRTEFHGHRDRVSSLTFAPDGRLLSGGLDTTVLVWDVRPPRIPAGGALGSAWDDLAGTDADAAFKAQGRILTDSAAALALLGEKIKPAEPVDAGRLAEYITGLDSAEFATRDQAMRALRELGGRVKAVLREAAEKSTSAEVRRRATDLLAEINDQVIPSVELRMLRAVEVLEWLNTPEARQLLRTWAKGAPGARLTDAAEGAGLRLKSSGSGHE